MTDRLPQGLAFPDDERPDVSVLVVNYNTGHLLQPMWDALMTARGELSLQVVVVDNASRDDSLRRLRDEPAFASADLIVNETNVGFGRANNQCVPRARGRYLLLLNTDAFVAPDTLQKTVAFMDRHPQCGLLGVQLIGRDGSPQPSCRYFPTPWNLFLLHTGLDRFFPKTRMVDDLSWDHSQPRACDWVPGCYLLIRREVVERIGLFDPRYFLYCEEVDLCRRAKEAGWSVMFFNDTRVVHLGGESARSDGPVTASGQQISMLQIESELLYFRKHHGVAGVTAYVVLSWLTDLVNAAKSLVRRRAPGPWREHAAALAAALHRTRLGSVPTR
jgi:GT2 family glycosyltransferase